jgi:ABC-type transporter Mla subunit MlaD
MSDTSFRTTLDAVRTALRRLNAAAAEDTLEAALVIDKMNAELATHLKTLEAMAPAHWQQHRDEVIALMADLGQLTDTLTRRQDDLREQMNRLNQQIKAQTSYGAK